MSINCIPEQVWGHLKLVDNLDVDYLYEKEYGWYGADSVWGPGFTCSSCKITYKVLAQENDGHYKFYMVYNKEVILRLCEKCFSFCTKDKKIRETFTTAFNLFAKRVGLGVGKP